MKKTKIEQSIGTKIFFENNAAQQFVLQKYRFFSTSRIGKSPDFLFQNDLEFLVGI